MHYLTQTRRRTAIVLGVITILLVAALVPAGTTAMFSPMMFDAPGSEGSIATIMAFWAATTLPIVILFSLVTSWIFFGIQRHALAVWISLLPLLNVFVFALGFLLID